MRRFALTLVAAALLALAACSASEGDPVETPYSLDGGKTLAEIGADGIPVEEHGFITMNASSSGGVVIAAAAFGKLYYSDDGGQIWWTLEGIGVEEYWTGASVSADGRHLAVAGSELYVSHDSGDTWTVYPTGASHDGQSALEISDDGATIARSSEHTITELDVSHDFGESWIESPFAGCDNLQAFALSADGRRVAALHYYEPLKLSDDGGETWAESPSGTGQWQDMAMSPDGTKLALLDFGGEKYAGEPKLDVYLSADGGGTWTSAMVEGIQGADAIALTDDGARVLASGSTVDAPFILSSDAGATWAEIPSPAKENPDWPQYTNIFSGGGDRIVSMERAYSVWTSEDLGLTWVKRLEGRGEE